MATRRPLIAGNWKMHGLRADGGALARALVDEMRAAGTVEFDILVCPPATLLADISRVLDGSSIGLGGQNCHQMAKGAHTGEVSADMLADLGCRSVILGHSERRADNGETDALVHAKSLAAREAGLTAIVCVGETAAERDAGDTLAVVGRQLAGSLADGVTAANTVIAYEPVWAIGTGRTPTPDEVQEVHAAIRSGVADRFAADEAAAVRILYGGSVKPDNAHSLMALADVDGALVGGASLVATDFWAIGQSCP